MMETVRVCFGASRGNLCLLVGNTVNTTPHLQFVVSTSQIYPGMGPDVGKLLPLVENNVVEASINVEPKVGANPPGIETSLKALVNLLAARNDILECAEHVARMAIDLKMELLDHVRIK